MKVLVGVLLLVLAVTCEETRSLRQSLAYFQELVDLPSGLSNQGGKTYLRQSSVRDVFGAPCPLTQECSSISSATLEPLIKTKYVHDDYRANGVEAAVDALKRALDGVKLDHPDLYNVIGYSGMLCCRAVRGSSSSYSNHAFGMAVDFNIGGTLDPRADAKAQRGLHILAPYMQDEGFFWAAGYSAAYEDAMHFEIAEETFQQWKQDGTLYGSGGTGGTTCTWPVVSQSSSSGQGALSNVRALQHLLNGNGQSVTVDGLFGSGTDAAVKVFQNANGLTVDGIVGAATWSALYGSTTVVSSSGGASADTVRAVQSLLVYTHGKSIAVDGAYGPNTQTAINEFQAAYFYTETGEVDLSQFQAMLNSCYNSLDFDPIVVGPDPIDVGPVTITFLNMEICLDADATCLDFDASVLEPILQDQYSGDVFMEFQDCTSSASCPSASGDGNEVYAFAQLSGDPWTAQDSLALEESISDIPLVFSVNVFASAASLLHTTWVTFALLLLFVTLT
mmetsp:Transcript_13726/g.39035  ORF Transcript_13726/g.39035 Transcript_13726/m.39035 type:complete len:505 (+) Transcript_13726:201-1715(+)|eukprot:CAMPEP_0119119846 /NCGR_PEP_ID=MMETSP1310-20130426/1155_1 /TAXON_ID=464262 /ORGANISM="Genus nov. species nov., Strain RCC2339" /LENGTH=504 /DNA_ID=CAMNT_0007109301 /DNA_START=160 /DNA_END=1674 /DNA_ORIENTATION=-